MKLWESGLWKGIDSLLYPSFLVSVVFVVLALWLWVKSPAYFHIWYRFKNRFATLADVQKMGLFDANVGALGCMSDQLVGLNSTYSVLCWAGSGMGKSSAVAVPSILESDEACVFAADCEGNLAKHTLGYRQELGKVFYFDWSKMDKPSLQEFYPRWNPLSAENLPPKGAARELYVMKLAKNLLSKNENAYWDRMVNLAMEGLLNIFISKIEQACANDYFLGKLLDKGKLSAEDRDILLSYYAVMPAEHSLKAIELLNANKLNGDSYLPIGSWAEVPKAWMGKEISLPMCSDCLIQRYFMITSGDENKAYDGWKIMLAGLIKEAKLFGYHKRSIQVLEYLFYLSSQQRSVIFTMLLEPLEVFRNRAVRERTSTSDFFNYQMRGIFDKTANSTLPITVYSVASNKAAKFMTKFMADMLIDANFGTFDNTRPILFVLDDFENMNKFDRLNEGVFRGVAEGMSFLMLTDGLKKLEETYGFERLENLIGNATYKLMAAEDNLKLADNFFKLMQFGVKTAQIPDVGVEVVSEANKAFADAGYYKKIARDLRRSSKADIVEKGQYILLAEGYYHLPIRLDSLFYKFYEELSEKAGIVGNFALNKAVAEKRNKQDSEPPELTEVLREVGIDIRNDEDIEKYIATRYEQTLRRIEHLKDKRTILAEDVSSRWKSSSSKEESDSEASFDDAWWMKEDSFSVEVKEDRNPFGK